MSAISVMRELLHVGCPEQARGRAVAAAGHGLEPGLLGQPQRQRVVRPRQHDDLRRLDQQSKPGGALHLRPLRALRADGARNMAQR